MRWHESDVWAQVAFYTGLGFLIPGALIVGYGAGWLLDRALNTAPALALVGALAGVAGGIVELLRILKRKERDDAKRANGSRTPDPP